MSDVTAEGKQVIERWLRAKEQLADHHRKVNSASCEVSNAETALAKWLLPPDAKPGEKIAVWFGDSLIQAEVGGVVSGDGEGPQCVSSTRVTIRLRGPKL